MSYRFRVDEGKLVLQVLIPAIRSGYGYDDRKASWRDATVEDIPVADPFKRPPAQSGGTFVEGLGWRGDA